MPFERLLGNLNVRRGVAVVLGVFAIAFAVRSGLSGADQSFSVVSGVLAVWAFVGGSGGPGLRPLPDLMPKIRGEIQALWKREADRQGIDEIYYIPPKIEVLRGRSPDRPATRFLMSRPRSESWGLIDLQDACTRTVQRWGLDRCVLYGAPGMGKTTIAIALTLGLLARPDEPGRLTPLTLSLAAWDTTEPFAAWLNRRLKAMYPSLRAVDTESSDLLTVLCASRRFLFILDDLDDLTGRQLASKLTAVNEGFPRGQALFVLSRPIEDPNGDGALRLRDAVELRLRPPTLHSVRLHLRLLARGQSRSRLRAIRRAISHHGDRSLGTLLQTPLYLRFMYRAVSSGVLDGQTLVATARVGGPDAARRLLIEAIVRRAMSRHPILRHRYARRWLGYFAHEMHERNYRAFAWYRLADAVPRPTLAVVCSFITPPAYMLSVVMPPGLTRGLALGVITTVVMGMMRGYPVAPTEAVRAVITQTILVAALGWSSGLELGRVAADTIVLVGGLGIVLVGKEQVLIDRGRIRTTSVVVGAVIGAGALLASTVSAVSAVSGYGDPHRSFAETALSAILGFGVAIAVVRLLIPWPRMKMQASQIQMTIAPRTERLLPALLSGVVASSLVGLCGGVVGGIRFDLAYGEAVFEYFGLAIGIPAGLAAGVMKWLSRPVANIDADIDVGDAAESSPLRRTLRSDRVVALTTITALTIASTVCAVLVHAFVPGLSEPLRAHALLSVPYLAVVQGVLLGGEFGIVVACLLTGWPTYFVSVMYLAARGRLPWRLSLFLLALQRVDILKQEGALLQFRYQPVGDTLAGEFATRTAERPRRGQNLHSSGDREAETTPSDKRAFTASDGVRPSDALPSRAPADGSEHSATRGKLDHHSELTGGSSPPA